MLERGKMDASLALRDGKKLEFAKIYPLDAEFDRMEDAPEELKASRRYRDLGDFTISGLASAVAADGGVDIVVHSLANGSEVKKPLSETSRKGYLSAISASAYSNVSLVHHFAPVMRKGGAFLSLSYMASQRVVPGYGGGMSSAKAALEADTRVLAYEIGRSHGHRVNVSEPATTPAGASHRFIVDDRLREAQLALPGAHRRGVAPQRRSVLAARSWQHRQHDYVDRAPRDGLAVDAEGPGEEHRHHGLRLVIAEADPSSRRLVRAEEVDYRRRRRKPRHQPARAGTHDRQEVARS